MYISTGSNPYIPTESYFAYIYLPVCHMFVFTKAILAQWIAEFEIVVTLEDGPDATSAPEPPQSGDAESWTAYGLAMALYFNGHHFYVRLLYFLSPPTLLSLQMSSPVLCCAVRFLISFLLFPPPFSLPCRTHVLSPLPPVSKELFHWYFRFQVRTTCHVYLFKGFIYYGAYIDMVPKPADL